jgi:hypothetical protein
MVQLTVLSGKTAGAVLVARRFLFTSDVLRRIIFGSRRRVSGMATFN